MNNVAIFGYGTVGKGVKDLISLNPQFNLVSIFDMPSKKDELGSLLVTKIDEIINNNKIDTVIECLGGDTLAHEVIIKSLSNHKNVITSNKETISLHLKEYLDLANKNNVSIQFEASVGGGIPIIYPLSIQSDFDSINEIIGILNGTTNFILTKMQKEHMPINNAILLAQKLGFAEKDPTSDLEGLDMVRKANILASIVTKKEINNDDIPHFGISKLNDNILKQINDKNLILKMLTRIEFKKDHISILIIPTCLRGDNLLSKIDYETNAISVFGKYQDPLMFVGKGAGKYPTASAILQDLIRVSKNKEYKYCNLKEKVVVKNEFTGTYLCFDDKDKLHELTNPDKKDLSKYKFVCLVD
ncbi:MAG: homoserine dehydrogenase [Bacilli bacterium]